MILSQTINRTSWTNTALHIISDKTQPRLRINNSLIIDIYPSFHCVGSWPKFGRKEAVSTDINQNGPSSEFELISKETGSSQPYSTDRDAWFIDFTGMEDRLLRQKGRDVCLSVVKTITNRHLMRMSPIFNPLNIRTVFMYVCEQHPDDESWTGEMFQDRVNSFLLQFVACLQSKCLPHFHLTNVNLLEEKRSKSLRIALEEAWKLARGLCTNPKFFKTV